MTRLVTISDKTLKVTGMAHDAASAAQGFKAFCQAWRDNHQGEPEPDFLHLRLEIWDDEIGPVVAREDRDDLDHQPPPGPITSLGIQGPSDYSSAGRVNADPAGERQRAAVARRPALPPSAEEVDAERAAAYRRQKTPEQAVATMLGLRLPERGATLAQVEVVARALGSSAVLLPGGEVKISGTFGEGVYVSMAAAAAALNARCYHPGAL